MPVHTKNGVALSVEIPIPSSIPRARGVNSTQAFGRALQVRMHEREVDLIGKEADRLGIPRSTFIRWCSVFVARSLQEHNEGVTDEDYDL